MKKFPLVLLLTALSVVTPPVVAQESPFAALLSAPAEQLTGYELLQKSPVGFWRGMSLAEFEARTIEKAGKRTLSLGEFEFVASNPTFDPVVGLVGVSVEYRSDDPAKIDAAFEAYKHALGNLKPDYDKASSGTPQIPDLKFAILGWKSPEGAESALARVHSYAAQAKNNGRTSAGLVTFGVRRH